MKARGTPDLVVNKATAVVRSPFREVSDWHGTRVPSGTVKSDFLEPLIKTLDNMVPCFDAA
jgi:hypothetical protein